MLGVVTALISFAAQSSIDYLGAYTQPLREGTAEIQGRVLDVTSRRPIPGLEVDIIEVDAGGRRGAGMPPRHTLTRSDSSGAFFVGKIGAGAYIVRVTGATHLAACTGTTQPDAEACARIIVEDGQAARDVMVYARPAAAMTGRIFDHEGRPKAGVKVSAGCCYNNATSDAEGRFKIGALVPGEITLSVEMPIDGVASERTYYPGVWDINAALPIAVIAAQTVNVDFHLPKLVMGSISAQVIGPSGFKLDRFELSQSDQSLQWLESPVAKIRNLREGRYVLHAIGSAGGKQYAGFKAVDVADGEVEVFVKLEEAGVIDGRIVTEGGGIPPLESHKISAWWWLDDDVVGAKLEDVSADGRFHFGNVFGDRTFRIGLLNGWRIVSIIANGRDVTDDVVNVAPGSHVEVTITVGRQ